MTMLEEWLAQYPESEPAATEPAIPTDENIEVAHLFGFDPKDLTWVYNPERHIVAVLGDVTVRFGKRDNDYGVGVYARMTGADMVYTPTKLAAQIRTRQIQVANARAYANRARVMTVMVLPLDMREAEAFATISHLCNHEGWKIFSVHTEHSQRAWVQIYTLTRD